MTDISVDISALSDARVGGFLWQILVDISVAACVAEIDAAEDPTVKILPPFQWLV